MKATCMRCIRRRRTEGSGGRRLQLVSASQADEVAFELTEIFRDRFGHVTNQERALQKRRVVRCVLGEKITVSDND